MKKVKRNKDLKFISKIAHKTGGFLPSLGTTKKYVGFKSQSLAPLAFFLSFFIKFLQKIHFKTE
jgi:hypothetical protein